MEKYKSFTELYTKVLVKISKKTGKSVLALADEFEKTGTENTLRQEYNMTMTMEEDYYIKKLGF